MRRHAAVLLCQLLACASARGALLAAVTTPSRSWSPADLMFAESAMYMTDGNYFTSACHLTKPSSTLCNPDQLLDKPAAADLEYLISQIAHGEGNYSLPALDGRPRGRYIAVVVVRHASVGVHAFAKEVYNHWILLKCGVWWSGCSNSVVLFIETDARAIDIYAGESNAAHAAEDDFAAIKEAMTATLRRWRDDALTVALYDGVRRVGLITREDTVEPELDDSFNWTYIACLSCGFVVCACCAYVRGVRESNAILRRHIR